MYVVHPKLGVTSTKRVSHLVILDSFKSYNPQYHNCRNSLPLRAFTNTFIRSYNQQSHNCHKLPPSESISNIYKFLLPGYGRGFILPEQSHIPINPKSFKSLHQVKVGTLKQSPIITSNIIPLNHLFYKPTTMKRICIAKIPLNKDFKPLCQITFVSCVDSLKHL